MLQSTPWLGGTMQENKNNNREPRYDSFKASELSYRAIFGEDYEKNKRWIFKKYEPFKNYLTSAFEAARTKKNSGAKFTIVNPAKDYNLSRCLMIKVESKLINGNIVNDPGEAEFAKKYNLPVEEININKITVNDKEVEFQLLDGGQAVINCTGNIVVNDNKELLINIDSYIPSAVIYNGKTIPVKGNKITIDNHVDNVCYDAKYKIKFNLNREGDSANKDELILQLEDSQSNEISVYDIFFNESAVEVFFDDHEREKFSIKKN